VPGYISLMSASASTIWKEVPGRSPRPDANSLAFKAGLSNIFWRWDHRRLDRRASSVILADSRRSVIIAFGLQLIGLLKIGALYKDRGCFQTTKPRGMLGIVTLGSPFAAGDALHVPILGGIIGLRRPAVVVAAVALVGILFRGLRSLF